jgi:pyrroline-5-carboxylate reductase
MRLAFIGGGNMARAIIGGLVSRGVAKAADITVVELDSVARLKLISEFGVKAVEKPGSELGAVDTVIFAVKPQQMREAAQAVATHLTDPLVITIAAGIRIDDLSRWLGGLERIVRAMPNTPALVHAGITGLYAQSVVGNAVVDSAEKLLAGVGAALCFV